MTIEEAKIELMFVRATVDAAIAGAIQADHPDLVQARDILDDILESVNGNQGEHSEGTADGEASADVESDLPF